MILHDAPMMSTGDDIVAEVRRARAKFPRNRFLLAALVEEVGELAEAIVAGDATAIRKEAIQVACVAVRIAEEGDASDYRNGPHKIVSAFGSLVIQVGRFARASLQRSGSGRFMARIEILCMVREGGALGGDPTFADVTDEEAKP